MGKGEHSLYPGFESSAADEGGVAVARGWDTKLFMDSRWSDLHQQVGNDVLLHCRRLGSRWPHQDQSGL